MYLPKDAAMLLSMINMKLRDCYESLDELCEEEDIDKEELLRLLSQAGYSYDPERNCFA
ncbi:MAG TPA: DUF4250 domain-containing protein [Candidatus Avilachnospira avistercoris]|nr:DUF4250 domain-containing protein [Candidatus Avilachnospira avistercoris]